MATPCPARCPVLDDAQTAQGCRVDHCRPRCREPRRPQGRRLGDGHDLVTTSDDTSLRVWSRTDAEINEARRLAGLRGSGGGKPIDAPRP